MALSYSYWHRMQLAIFLYFPLQLLALGLYLTTIAPFPNLHPIITATIQENMGFKFHKVAVYVTKKIIN
jgi:hypothetical protein